MSGLDTLPDAPAVAQMVIAATGDSPTDLRIVGQGVTAVAWRVEVDRAVEGGAYCVLVGLPKHGPESEWPGAGGQIAARAAVLSALRERDPRCPEVFGTACSAGTPERLRRWSWIVTSWMRGAPLEDSAAMTSEVARELGGLLATLHSIPVSGHGLLADTAEELRGASDDPGTDFTSRWGRALWPFDGRPLAAHPLVQVAPQLVLRVGQLREQLLAYATQGARGLCHSDFQPAHVWVEDGHLAGLIDFGDAAVLPPATDLALFASTYGWPMLEALLEGYATNSVLRDIRRAEAYQLAVLVALQRIEKYVRIRPDEARVRGAVEFLEATLPQAARRMDA
ncbi:MAG: aminoglycoside phosphotransferase family protein [Dehalococcoidia bacterium]|nr:aminoglycoside phosphotransferase family protein [Dehalococcoidia bacterium]